MVQRPVSQVEYIEISRLVTLGTEASQVECIEISRLVTLGTEASQSDGVYRD